MTVFKRGKVYHYEFQYNGNRYRGSTGCTNKQEAEAVEAKIKADLRAQKHWGAVPDMTLGEAIDRYFDTVILPKANQIGAKNTLGRLRFLREELGPDTLLKDIDRLRLVAYRDGLVSGKVRKNRLARATVDRLFNDVRAILNCAVDDWGTLLSAPKVPFFNEDNKKTRFLTSQEAESLINSTDTQHVKDMIEFYLETGARAAEGYELQWSNVLWESGTHGRIRFTKTKSKKARGVPISKRLRKILDRLNKERDETIPYVFTFKGAKAGNPKKAIGKAIERAGLKSEDKSENVTMHTLRHTYASWLVQKGIPLLQVSRYLGHSSIKTTERYAHLAPEGDEVAIEALDNWRPEN